MTSRVTVSATTRDRIQLLVDELTVDFIFTFKLDGDDPKDKYVNRINFFSTPYKVSCQSTSSSSAFLARHGCVDEHRLRVGSCAGELVDDVTHL
jgi:hypothetical protein